MVWVLPIRFWEAMSIFWIWCFGDHLGELVWLDELLILIFIIWNTSISFVHVLHLNHNIARFIIRIQPINYIPRLSSPILSPHSSLTLQTLLLPSFLSSSSLSLSSPLLYSLLPPFLPSTLPPFIPSFFPSFLSPQQVEWELIAWHYVQYLAFKPLISLCPQGACLVGQTPLKDGY